MSSTDLLLGLGIGAVLGFAIGYLFAQRGQGGMLTDFTRDEKGRLISIVEKPIKS